MAEKALIMELYIGKAMTLVEIGLLLSLSPETVSRAVSLYFKKPKKDVVKPSRV